jgi:hypothetical protein
MDSIWMGIAPSREATRVVAMSGPSSTILKAQLARDPKHPRALATLLEAVALWQGQPVRAALCADAGDFRTTRISVANRSWTTGVRSTASSGCPRARTASGGTGSTVSVASAISSDS